MGNTGQRNNDMQVEEELIMSQQKDINLKHNVIIETSDAGVTLSGKVRSWAEHDDAMGAAWAASGVMKVVDHLSISA